MKRCENEPCGREFTPNVGGAIPDRCARCYAYRRRVGKEWTPKPTMGEIQRVSLKMPKSMASQITRVLAPGEKLGTWIRGVIQARLHALELRERRDTK